MMFIQIPPWFPFKNSIPVEKRLAIDFCG